MSRFRAPYLLCIWIAGLLLGVPAYAQFSSRNLIADCAESVQPLLFELPLSSDHPDTPSVKTKPRLGAITTGWTYLWADQGDNYRSNLNGWFLRPSVNIGKDFSLFFDSTNYYGRNKMGSVNSHGYTFGLAKEFFPKARIRPSIFAESGDVRSSSAGSIVNQFAFAAGASFSIPFNRHVELAVTPAEYVFVYPNGDPRNDYNAKIGLSFPFGHR